MSGHPEQAFQAVMAAAGLTPPNTINADGGIHRFSSDGRRGDDAGWYALHLDGVPAGAFGCWRSDVNSTWCAKSENTMTQAERGTHRQRMQVIQGKRQSERAHRHQESAAKAAQQWQAGVVCTAHAYLSSKSIPACGVRIDASGALLVPMRDAAGKLHSLQTITAGGDKRFLFGGRVKGCYHSLGEPEGLLIVCEGYATGASLYEATGHAVAVAFNAGNLEAVASALRAKFPALKIIIAADDDHRTDGNPGITKATAAATAVGALLAVPMFGADRPNEANDFNDLHRLAGAEAVQRCIDAAAASVGEPASSLEWPNPEPLIARLDPADYPLDALPDCVRLAVAEVAGFVKAPVPLIATSALAALSIAIQAHADVERAAKLSGPTSLFLLAVADSGERKSTCDGFFTRAVKDYETRAQEDAKPVLVAYKTEFDVWEAKRCGLKEKIKTLAKEGKPTTAQEQDLHALDNEEPTPPRVPRLIYGDATPEALAFSLAKNWPSGGVVSSEAGSVFGSHGMGKESAMRNLAMLNQLWDGAALPVERRSSESFTVRGARLTMALQVQESTLRAFFDSTKGLARGTGFLARFLTSWPESTQGTRYFTEAPEHWPHLSDFNARLTNILNQPVPMNEDGALEPAMFKLAPDAKAAWVAFHDAIEAELSRGGELHDVRDVASKTADNAARLAALFHVFTGKVGTIGIDSMESAARITYWHLTEARRFLGELAVPVELANAVSMENWALEYCRKRNTDKLTTREIQRHGPNAIREKSALDKALKELIELGRVKLIQDGKKRLVQVNPALLCAAARGTP